MRIDRNTILLVASLPLIFGGVVYLRNGVQHEHDETVVPDEINYTPSAALLKPASLGFSELFADYYWLKTIQYFGDQKFPSSEYLRHLYALTDLVTDLAPEFDYVYRFGATTLTMNDSNGDLAEKLLLKGLTNAPMETRIPFLLGYVYYYLLLNPKKASVFYDTAATVAFSNGDPGFMWLRPLARKLLIDADNPDLMLPVLEKMVLDESDPVLRAKFVKRKNAGITKRNILYLQREVDRFNLERGRPPRDLDELVEERYVNLIPPDSEKGGYYLDGNTVRVSD